MVVRFSHFVPVEAPPVQKSQVKALSLAAQKPSVTVCDQFQAAVKSNAGLKFGSREQEDDVTFKKLFSLGKKLAKKTYQTAKVEAKQTYKEMKAKAKAELAKPGSEKRVAAIGAGAGAAIGLAAEACTGGLSGGQIGTVVGTSAATALTGYLGAKAIKQHEQEKAAGADHPILEESSSDDEAQQ